jgi:hypothetical protein
VVPILCDDKYQQLKSTALPLLVPEGSEAVTIDSVNPLAARMDQNFKNSKNERRSSHARSQTCARLDVGAAETIETRATREKKDFVIKCMFDMWFVRRK